MKMYVLSYFVLFAVVYHHTGAQFYEDSRCSCVCLSPNANGQHVKTFYQENHISPEQCSCRDMVLPRVASKTNATWLLFCIQCECHFETRNTTMVMIVVVFLCIVISVLVLYMLCLKGLERIIVVRRPTMSYQTEDDKELHVLLNGTCQDTSDVED